MKMFAGFVFFLALSSLASAEILTHNNQYRGLKVGVSTLADVVDKFGSPTDKKINSNNVRYYYPNFHVTIQDKTGRINTIIIMTRCYQDANGIRVGFSQRVVEKAIREKRRGNAITDSIKGITYWFDQKNKVSRIVLAHKTVFH